MTEKSIKSNQTDTDNAVSEETKSEKKSSKKRFLIGCGSAIVIAILLGIFMLGSEMNVKSYVNRNVEIYNDSQKRLETATTPNVSETRNNFRKIAEQSDRNLDDINKKEAPRVAQQLKKDLVEYYTLTKKISTGFTSVYDLIDKADKVSQGFKSVKIDNTSYETQASSLRSLKNTFDPILIEVDSMVVPPEVAKNHATLKTYYHNFSSALDKAILGSDTKDGAVVSAAKIDMTTAADGIKKAFDITDLYKVEVERATVLEKNIQEEVNELND